MFARMPRYGPAGHGTHVTSARGVAAQLRMSWHSCDSSFQKMPLSSGLLIRGFGVQVPGGAPGLTWGFIAPGHFYLSVLSPWLLRGCSRARTQQSGVSEPPRNRVMLALAYDAAL